MTESDESTYSEVAFFRKHILIGEISHLATKSNKNCCFIPLLRKHPPVYNIEYTPDVVLYESTNSLLLLILSSCTES